MPIQCSERVLLTGAGFTHNFGTPLARDMWAEIFNCRRVQEEPAVRKLLMSDFDFESVYNTVMNGAYTTEEKTAISEAVTSAYSLLDSLVIEYFSSSDSPREVSVYRVQQFIEEFATQPGKSFFFTLNQDLFIERRYYNGPRPLIPGIQENPNWFSSNYNRPLEQSDYCYLPPQSALDASKPNLLSGRDFVYIKLHGSQNWRSASGSQQMVIGRGKATQIQNEPLLAWYYEVFRGVLLQSDRHLLVIGYGFGDDHINEVIAEAVDQHGLRVYVLSPSPVDEFSSRLLARTHGQRIWEGLGGYFPYPLREMLRTSGMGQAYWKLREHFFNKR